MFSDGLMRSSASEPNSYIETKYKAEHGFDRPMTIR